MSAVDRKEYYKQWYQKNKKQVSEYQKQYYQLNKEDIIEKRKNYYSSNKEQIAEKGKVYREKYKTEVAERKKTYRETHRNNINEYSRNWYKNRNEEEKERSRQYRKSQNGRTKSMLNSYRKRDIANNRGECTLTTDWIIDNIFNSSCVYCGDSDWTHLGADRIDNSKPHTPENCVCACFLCNAERADRYSVEEFKEYRKTHPRFSPDQKSWEIIEMKGIKVLKKRAID